MFNVYNISNQNDTNNTNINHNQVLNSKSFQYVNSMINIFQTNQVNFRIREISNSKIIYQQVSFGTPDYYEIHWLFNDLSDSSLELYYVVPRRNTSLLVKTGCVETIFNAIFLHSKSKPSIKNCKRDRDIDDTYYQEINEDRWDKYYRTD